MKILKEDTGYFLIERYERPYVRFLGGRNDDFPCEFPVSEEDAQLVIADSLLIDELISRAMAKLEWTEESFRKIAITEYLRYFAKLTEERVNRSYEKLLLHKDIRNEFHRFIVDDSFPEIPMVVEGFTAEHLATNYPLSPLGAYNYLVYLRENPKEALADLKKGLPRRKVFNEARLKEIQTAMENDEGGASHS